MYALLAMSQSMSVSLLRQVHSVCCCVPFYHTFGCAMGTLAALLNGARQVSPNPHFDPLACLQTMEGERSVVTFYAESCCILI